MRSWRALPILVVVAAVARSQEEPRIDVGIAHQGVVPLVDLVVEDASLVEVLGRLAPVLEARLVIAPDALEAAHEARVRADASRLPAGDVVRFLAAAHGLVGELGDGEIRLEREVGGGAEGEAREEARTSFVRRRAVEAWERTLLLPGGDDPADAFFKLGFLEYEGGRNAEALGRFLEFERREIDPDDPRLPKALLAAGTCALRLGNLEQARLHLGRIEEHVEGGPELYRAQLLHAVIARRLARAADDDEGRAALLHESRLRLDRVIKSCRDERLVALAILLKTELLWAEGDAREAVSVLELFDTDLQRDNRDLARRLPLIRGLVLLRAGDAAGAIPALRVALVREKDRQRRVRAIHALAVAFRDHGDAWSALMAVDDAAARDPSPARRLALLSLRADLLLDLGLVGPAVATLERLVEDIGDAPAGGAGPGDVFRRVAEVQFAAHRHEEAKAYFGRLAEHPRHRPWALLMLARCALELDRPEEALSVLDHLSAADEEAVGRSECWGLRGRIYEALGEPRKAVLAYGGWREER